MFDGLTATGAGAIFDLYLRKRAEDRAIKEGFQEFLERDRTFNTFRREQISE